MDRSASLVGRWLEGVRSRTAEEDARVVEWASLLKSLPRTTPQLLVILEGWPSGAPLDLLLWVGRLRTTTAF